MDDEEDVQHIREFIAEWIRIRPDIEEEYQGHAW